MTRQTKTFLLDRFREMGIRPATRHGQNFLIDLNLQRLIVDAAELTADDVVLEIGTGTGSLTAMMADSAAAVVTVEIDAHLFELASEQLIDLPNVTMLQLDALRNKNNFDDRVMEAVGEHLPAAPGRRLKLVANLPYNIATPVLSNLLLCAARAAFDDGHDPEGAGRPHHGQPFDQGLQCAERVDSEPVHGGDRPRAAAVGVLAGAEGDFGRDPAHRRSRAASGNSPTCSTFTRSPKRCSSIAANFLRANVVAAMKRHLDKEQVDAILRRNGLRRRHAHRAARRRHAYQAGGHRSEPPRRIGSCSSARFLVRGNCGVIAPNLLTSATTFVRIAGVESHASRMAHRGDLRNVVHRNDRHDARNESSPTTNCITATWPRPA